MTPRRQSVRLAIYIIGGLLFLWFAQRATGQVGSIWDVPPARYQRVVAATVHYSNRDRVIEVCQSVRATGCQIGAEIYVPVECSPSRHATTRFEVIDVAAEYRGGTWCGGSKGHEGAHVAGWPANHPR